MIDPRLFPLFETLSRANLDWLVQEILAVLISGEVPLASANELTRARQRIADRQEVSAADLPDIETVGEVRQYPGNEQIRIAGSLVVSRITDSILMTKASIEGLDRLVGELAGSKSAYTYRTTIQLVDDIGEQPSRSVDSAAIRKSFEALVTLRQAVEQWQEYITAGDAR